MLLMMLWKTYVTVMLEEVAMVTTQIVTIVTTTVTSAALDNAITRSIKLNWRAVSVKRRKKFKFALENDGEI